MKLHTLTLAVAGALFMGSCSSSEPTTVVGSQERGNDQQVGNYVDRTNDDVDFTKFKTYGWATQVNDASSTAYFLNDATYKTLIRDAVAHELDSRGYVYQPSNPDLVVNFRVFDQPTEIKDQTAYGDRYWGANEYRSSGRLPGVVKLDAGSVIMQVVDRASSEVIWQGYASGLNEGGTMSKEQTKVASTVSEVFAQYNHRASGQ